MIIESPTKALAFSDSRFILVYMEKTWLRGAVYQIYPRSFCDSNGDGIGDIQGIISKLDYLKDLGVKILWLSPIYKSPLFDMGYDVSDYYDIHEDYGTMEDFEQLLLEAKKRDLKIVMDLVVNHTSMEHEWFRHALKGEQPYHDYYIFKKGKKQGEPPNNWTSMFSGTAWEYVPELDEWYLHLYDKAQPDLNWHNPAVLEEVEKILRFYLDKGVYGFRCDVINQIYKDSFADGQGTSPSGRGKEHYLMKEGNHQVLKRLHEDVFSKYEDYVVIGETLDVDIPNGQRFLKDNELDMFFTFEHMDVGKKLGGAILQGFKPAKLREVLYKYQKEIPWNALYFENHDQPRSLAHYGDEGKYRDASAKALATLLLTLKGTPFIYQGQELGALWAKPRDPRKSEDCCAHALLKMMKSVFHLPTSIAKRLVYNLDRDRCRAPMAWAPGPGIGFTTAEKAWLPFTKDDELHNVKTEENSANSVLNFYKSLLLLRKENEELTLGQFHEVPTSGSLFAYRRRYENRELLILVNLSKKTLRLPRYLHNIAGDVVLESGKARNPNSLPPYGVKIIRVA